MNQFRVTGVLAAGLLVWICLEHSSFSGRFAHMDPRAAAATAEFLSVSSTKSRSAPVPRSSQPPSSSGSEIFPFSNDPRDSLSILEKISDATVSYDASAVANITPYLLNPNKEVRRIAVDGLIRTGDASGVGVLRDAAKRLSDPREATVFLDAADFLALPSAATAGPP